MHQTACSPLAHCCITTSSFHVISVCFLNIIMYILLIVVEILDPCFLKNKMKLKNDLMIYIIKAEEYLGFFSFSINLNVTISLLY